MKLTIYYSVSNGGDGSAYPHFFETLQIAEMDQDLMEEGWGESCTGSITIEGDNLKVTSPEVKTVEEFKAELEEIIEDDWSSSSRKKQATKFLAELNKPSKKKTV